MCRLTQMFIPTEEKKKKKRWTGRLFVFKSKHYVMALRLYREKKMYDWMILGEFFRQSWYKLSIKSVFSLQSVLSRLSIKI